MRLADRMYRLKTENAFVVLAKAKELERQGRDIIHLEIGDTDFDTPTHIVEEAYAQMKRGQTHYCPSAGLLELRQACCEWLRREGRGDYSPNQIVVGPGKLFLYSMIMTLAGPGDEVIYPDPGFPVYESVILYSGAKAVPLPILEENNFRVNPDDLASRVTDRTRLLILNYPHNPTGGMLTRTELDAVAEITAKKDIPVLSDEVYAHMLFTGKHISLATLPGMQDRTVMLESFSKTYAMTGWRLGYGVMPVDVAQAVSRLITNSVSCTGTATQIAGVKALTAPQDDVDVMVAEFKKRRELIVNGLNQIPGFHCLMPKGAFYAFPNIAETGMKSKDLADYLLADASVATLAGTAFGHYGEGFLRLSYANSVENINKALDRIDVAVRKIDRKAAHS